MVTRGVRATGWKAPTSALRGTSEHGQQRPTGSKPLLPLPALTRAEQGSPECPSLLPPSISTVPAAAYDGKVSS